MTPGAKRRIAVRPAAAHDIAFMERLFVLLAFQRNPNRQTVDVDAIVCGTREATLDQVQGALKDSTTYVVEFDDRPVGRLRVVRTPERIEIAGLQVLPAYQRRGIGTAVIMALLQEERAKALSVVLQDDKDNPAAERLYARLGFELAGETADTKWRRARSSRQE